MNETTFDTTELTDQDRLDFAARVRAAAPGRPVPSYLRTTPATTDGEDFAAAVRAAAPGRRNRS